MLHTPRIVGNRIHCVNRFTVEARFQSWPRRGERAPGPRQFEKSRSVMAILWWYVGAEQRGPNITGWVLPCGPGIGFYARYNRNNFVAGWHDLDCLKGTPSRAAGSRAIIFFFWENSNDVYQFGRYVLPVNLSEVWQTIPCERKPGIAFLVLWRIPIRTAALIAGFQRAGSISSFPPMALIMTAFSSRHFLFAA